MLYYIQRKNRVISESFSFPSSDIKALFDGMTNERRNKAIYIVLQLLPQIFRSKNIHC